jgi:hypothetical protein
MNEHGRRAQGASIKNIKNSKGENGIGTLKALGVSKKEE